MGAGQFDQGGLYNVSYTLGQTAAGPYGKFGEDEESYYFIGAGFQYIYQIGEFRFTISDIDIDLGLLSPGSHSAASNTLGISTRGAGGYTIYAYEQYPLAHVAGLDFIPDTDCDDGFTCTPSLAKPWTDESVPGFGFNAQGDNVSQDFTTANPDCLTNDQCFRPFANASAGDNMEAIMESEEIASNEQATITYKAGIGGGQAAGRYETGIIYVVVPGY